jgi:hypothetical protein
MRRTTLLLVVAPLLLAGCGGHSLTPKQKAELIARHDAMTDAISEARRCHEKRPRITKIACNPTAEGWDCSYSLSDGSGGQLVLLRHPTGITHPEITSIAC